MILKKILSLFSQNIVIIWFELYFQHFIYNIVFVENTHSWQLMEKAKIPIPMAPKISIITCFKIIIFILFHLLLPLSQCSIFLSPTIGIWAKGNMAVREITLQL